MNATQIHSIFKSIVHQLSNARLKSAFAQATILTTELQMGEYTDRLNDLQQNYQYLLQYYVAGVDDPQRKSVYNKLVGKLYSLCSELNEELMMRNSDAYEYTQKRYFPYARRFNSVAEMQQALRYYHSQSALLLATGEAHSVELNRLRTNYETVLAEVFNLFWLKTRYESDEKNLFGQLLQSEYPGWQERSLMISAITLNLWRMFDEQKLGMLFDACASDDLQTRQRALVAVCFILARHNLFLTYFPQIRNRLVLLADDSHLVENFCNIMIQIIASSDTDKITKKMQEEILPEVIKMSPKFRESMDADAPQNQDEWNDENPQWQDMLEESGVADKLKELSELQMEGADVYMSTFSLLKSFPFFSTFSNWFMPFDPRHSAVSELFGREDKSLLSAFVNNNAMCNSDKYSFCLSVMQMPDSQRQMLKQSFQAEAEQLDEMNKDEAMLTPDVAAKHISKQYIQDLFRFFRLNPQRAYFQDFFAFSLSMHRTYLFDILSANSGFKSDVAEYYFSKNHYVQALELFDQILNQEQASAALYQKAGFCYQKTAQYAKALEAYSKADIIQPDDLWTLRKMAFCYRMSGNFTKALDIYLHIDFLKPDQKAILLQIGHCKLELGNYKDALAVYFKLDALGDEDIRVWRAILWCSFVSGNIAQAYYYSEKILGTSPTAQDVLNCGHVAWCRQKLSDAVSHYRHCLVLLDGDFSKFVEIFEADKQWLLANGVETSEMNLMLDVLQPSDYNHYAE